MSELAEPTRAVERPSGVLRRELRVWEAFAISIGIMAPTAAMALNGVAPAGLVGRACLSHSSSPRSRSRSSRTRSFA